jgi:sugar phosphate isomerase/epimerase
MIDCIERILRAAGLRSRHLAIETLDYPPQWFAPVVERMDLAVCVDVGHILNHEMHLEQILQMFEGRIDMLHLHGAAGGHDHRSLECLPPPARNLLKAYLRDYRGTVTVEVFNFLRLEKSLAELERMMEE